MNLLDVVILSIVEGISEFLPISSTGHLILVSSVLKIQPTEFVKTFEVVIQLGAILSVLVLYTKRVLQNPKIILKLLVAFAPTMIVGLILYEFIKQYLFETPIIVALSLIIGGVALIGIEKYFQKASPSPYPSPKGRGEKKNALAPNDNSKSYQLTAISYKQAFLIGLFQSISIVPGVSRAASTIFGGLFMGLDRKSAVEFSFLLALPTMTAATGLDLLKTSGSFTPGQIQQLVIGTMLSFIVALAAIRWLLKYVQTHTFIPFGIYRIILGILFILFFLKKPIISLLETILRSAT